jgi:hypothetical protein
MKNGYTSNDSSDYSRNQRCEFVSGEVYKKRVLGIGEGGAAKAHLSCAEDAFLRL